MICNIVSTVIWAKCKKNIKFIAMNSDVYFNLIEACTYTKDCQQLLFKSLYVGLSVQQFATLY